MFPIALYRYNHQQDKIIGKETNCVYGSRNGSISEG